MRPRRYALFALAGLVVIAAGPGARATPSLSPEDRGYLAATAMSDHLEIDSAYVARSRSHSAAIRGLALRILDDDRTSLREAGSLGSHLGVVMPSALDAAHEKQLDRLRFVAGASFDAAYLAQEHSDEVTALADTRAEISRGANGTLIAWAKSQIFALSEHLALVRRTRDAVDRAPSPSPSPTQPHADRPNAAPVAEARGSGLPGYGWALIGVGALAVLTGAARRRRHRRPQ